MNSAFLLALAPAIAAPAASDEAIIVTASLEPQSQENAPVSSTIIAPREIEQLNLPRASDLLRLTPGVSVATSGPAGSQTQIRIRGAEASHSLLYVDGIRFNDPAAGNEARFELLAGDALSRIEVVRGPQSALWGSEAMGGVISVESADARRSSGVSALAEYGSLQAARGAAQVAGKSGGLALSSFGSWLSSRGIDALGEGGERDAFHNRALGAKAVFTPSARVEVGAVGHWIAGRTQFDDFDPAILRRGNTLHSTRNEIAAGRLWASLALGTGQQWKLAAGTSLLESTNRNRLGEDPLNRTGGKRWTVDLRLSRNLDFGRTRHRITVAGERQEEDFRARDQSFGGATRQDRSRSLTAFAAEVRSDWSDLVATDFALRHDEFSQFPDTTTVRASLLLRPAEHWTMHAAYGEGVAQPSFYDLFGFLPGSFVGNPGLQPESSRSWEMGVRWANPDSRIAITGFTGRLDDEILDVFDPDTFLSSTVNAGGSSRRRGIEVEVQHRFAGQGFAMLNYTLLDAEQQQDPAGRPLREIRRPRHSANLFGSWTVGPLKIGGSLAYVGARKDTDFESFPSRTVKLGDYLLASLNLEWRMGGGISAYLRTENLFGEHYEDAFGYETSGRTIHAGLRLRLGA